MTEELQINMVNFKISKSILGQKQEYKESPSYPGLQALFRYYLIEVKTEGLPAKDFWTKEINKEDKVEKHFWKWMRESDAVNLINSFTEGQDRNVDLKP